MRPSIAVVEESSIGQVESLIAVIQKMWHSGFDVEDHLTEHTISPAEPATVVSRWAIQNQEGRFGSHHDRV